MLVKKKKVNIKIEETRSSIQKERKIQKGIRARDGKGANGNLEILESSKN